MSTGGRGHLRQNRVSPRRSPSTGLSHRKPYNRELRISDPAPMAHSAVHAGGREVRNEGLIRRAEPRQPLQLRELLQRGGGLSFLHTFLLLQTPRSPVEDRELSTDYLHNH